MLLAKRNTTKLTGLYIDSHQNKGTINNMEKDSIPMTVIARGCSKHFKTLFGSGATRCFITSDCYLVRGLTILPPNKFLELVNREQPRSTLLVQNTSTSMAKVI